MTTKSTEIIIIASLSILVGSLYIGPPLMIKEYFERSGEEFTLAQFKTYRNSLLHYLPRAREIYDGNFPPADLSGDIREQPTVMNTLTSTLSAASMFITKGNMNAAYLLTQFIFSALAFAGFYLVGRIILESRLWSVLMALAGTLTPIPGKLPFYDWRGWNDFLAFFVKNFIPVVKTQFDKLYLAQIDNPLLTVPFYLLACWSLYRFWKQPSYKKAVLAGLFAGLLFYIYFHLWVFWVVLIGILFGYAVAFERKNAVQLKSLALLTATTAVMAIPYFVNYFKFSQLPASQDYTFRLGLAQGRFIGINSANILDYLVYLLLIPAIYFICFRANSRKAVFLWSMCATMITVWNIQLLVGYVPVPHTWFKVIGPTMFIILFILAHDLIKKYQNRHVHLKKMVVLLVVLLSVATVTKKIVNVLEIKKSIQPHLVMYYAFPNDITASWGWINNNLEPEPKLLSPSSMNSFYLNTYTSARPYLATAFTTLLSMKEIEERYLTAHKLFKVPEDILRQRLERKVPIGCLEYQCPPDKDSNLNDSVWHIYGNYFASKYGDFRHFLRGADSDAPDAIELAKLQKFDELIERYRLLKTDWKSSPADYAYYGPWEQQINSVRSDLDENLTLIYKNPSVAIYRIKK
ncbi:MAG: hypothetical protein HY454_00700 [Parcubacteria group bacterium]|nr:hypothetical protein [Parcubacteria group bacterium]